MSATPALAHDRTTSYSGWDIRGRRAQVTVRVAELDLTRLPWAATPDADFDQALGAYLSRNLQLRAGTTPCAVVAGPRRLAAPPGRAVFEWRLDCPADGGLEIRSALLLDVAPTHLHFARVMRDGAPVLERVLSDAERSWLLDQPAAPGSGVGAGTSLGEYIALGIEHILTGYDHLAFLLALLLFGSSLGEVAKVVTGFTVAHSITLGLTILGYVRPEARSVEALIGLSIALVAAENVWLGSGRTRVLPAVVGGGLACLALAAAAGHGRVPPVTLAGLSVFTLCYFGLLGVVAHPAQLRWAIAFIFGLVHGFGFAAVLVEAHLPTERLAHALFGFNVGVEVGQLAVVALVWPLLHLAARRADLRQQILEVGSAAVCGLGLFWFVLRAYG